LISVCIVAYIISESDCTQSSKSIAERVLIFFGEEVLAFSAPSLTIPKKKINQVALITVAKYTKYH
jgi:hypothetical protein